jgi:hypothetical protein
MVLRGQTHYLALLQRQPEEDMVPAAALAAQAVPVEVAAVLALMLGGQEHLVRVPPEEQEPMAAAAMQAVVVVVVLVL